MYCTGLEQDSIRMRAAWKFVLQLYSVCNLSDKIHTGQHYLSLLSLSRDCFQGMPNMNAV